MAESWNVVAAGHSREHLRPEHFLDGPVVSINRAIDIVDRGLRVDFAAFSDGPQGCWEPLGLEKHLRPGMQVWASLKPTNRIIPKGDIKTNVSNDIVLPGGGPPIAWLWDRALPIFCGLRFIPPGNCEDAEKPRTYRIAFTTLCVLKRIWDFKPKKVRILCSDMKGSWIAGLTEEECRAKEGWNRWIHERKTLDAELKRARKDGIEVEELIPEPEAVPV